MDSKDLHNLSEAWNNITLSEEYLSEGQALNILEELGPEGYQELLECVEYLYERSLTSSDLQVVQQAQAARQKAAEQQSRTAPTGIGSDPRSGALGQLIRTIQKTGITGPAGRQAALDYDAAIAALRKNNPNAKPGALESDIATAAQVRQQMQAIRDKRAGSTGGGGGGNIRPSAPVLSPQQIARQKANAEYQALRTKDPTAAKAKGMETFAKFNPKLAAAAAERARIRGTAQTDNPLMRDMRSRLPQVTPSIQAPAVAKLGAGNQSLVQNRNAIRGAAPKPVAATAPITNRVATAYGSGAKPIVPMAKPIVARPLPTARPVAATALRPGLRLQHTDLFDIVKGHLMNEGATEEEALKKMVNMTQEERNAILGEKE